ncbi:MAG TPA: FMN-binding negative transcriptional regulator [Anaerolineae bacterium]|jgi:transcriptional regulator
MYIPKSFAETETAVLYQFMQANSFATILTTQDNAIAATHLPFLVDSVRGMLRAHMARANPQWQAFDGRQALVIFQGPHAYVSPTWYESQPSVPTWNYTAVHAHGVPSIITDERAVHEMLAELVVTNERGRQPEWKLDVPADYLHGMMRGIVAFELRIERIEGVFKLSQNHSMTDQQNVAAHLAQSTYVSDQAVGELMTQRGARTSA